MGRCTLLIPLTPFCVCQPISYDSVFGDKSQNSGKAVHYCDGQVMIVSCRFSRSWSVEDRRNMNMSLLMLQWLVYCYGCKPTFLLMMFLDYYFSCCWCFCPYYSTVNRDSVGAFCFFCGPNDLLIILYKMLWVWSCYEKCTGFVFFLQLLLNPAPDANLSDTIIHIISYTAQLLFSSRNSTQLEPSEQCLPNFLGCDL